MNSAIEVRLFARFRDAAGAESVAVPVPNNVTALRRQLATLFPTLIGLLTRSAVAVNGEFADDDTPISPGDEIALIPPVSGG